MTKIKICGITNKVDAVEAARSGVDMLGFIFYKKSPRFVSQKSARDIINELPGDIMKVGVFVDEEPDAVLSLARSAGLDAAQLHGGETPECCADLKESLKVIKAFRIKDKKDLSRINGYDVDFYLLDTYQRRARGGTGKTFDWGIISDFEFLRPIILSGGLNPGNILDAIKTISPFGVDVSSGIEESPGKKDLKLMKKFVEEIRKADLHEVTR